MTTPAPSNKTTQMPTALHIRTANEQTIIVNAIETNDVINRVETGNEAAVTSVIPNQADDVLIANGRKPYLHSQPADWYQHNAFFKRYMLRELTAVPVVLEAFNLCWGLVSLASSVDSWQRWVNVQTNFLMVIFHLFVIIAALYNSVTWFAAMPKAIRIQQGEKFVADNILIGGSWLTFIVILIGLIVMVSYFA